MKKLLSVLLCLMMLLSCTAFATAPDTIDHYFGPWEYRHLGFHRGICQNEDCGFVLYIPCGELSADFEGKTFTVCPVCGHYGDKDGSFVPYNVRADLYAYNDAPMGELCVHCYDDPFEDGSVKAAFSVIFEKGGLRETYEGGFRLTFPTVIEGEFTVVNASGEEVESSYENGLLTITCDTGCGIYFVK